MKLDVGFHEGKACDAVVRILEAREKATRCDVTFPEEENHRAPVELTFKLNGQLFAMEHTGIEPFEGHVNLTALAKSNLLPIEDLVAKRGSFSEHVDLQIPEAGLRALKKSDAADVQAALADWVMNAVHQTEIVQYGSYQAAPTTHDVPGVPFPVVLYRFDALGHGGFFRVSVTLESFDRDVARADRIRRACDKKFPKLDAWKKSAGAKTILVLEDNDIQFTNQSVVAETLLPFVKAGQSPDEIWLVISCTDPWVVFPMLTDGKSYFEQTGRWFEFHPAKLEAATSRSYKESVRG